jgi:hypothetical protein
VVLGYDLVLGLVMSLVGWKYAHYDFWLVTLHWMAPLFLVAGLALVLSLRFSFATAAGIAYVVWLSGLGLAVYQWAPLPGSWLVPLASSSMEVVLGVIGLSGIVIALMCMPWRLPALLPRC